MDGEDRPVEVEDEDVKAARIIVDNLDPLLKQEGWNYFMAMLEKQINVRKGRMPVASDGFGAVFKSEFEKGEIAGLMLARTLAPGALGAAVELLTEMKKEEENVE